MSTEYNNTLGSVMGEEVDLTLLSGDLSSAKQKQVAYCRDLE